MSGHTAEQFFSTLLFTLAETAPYVLVGYAIAAIVREFLPRDALARWLGSRGIAPLFKAIGIGAILPICSCGVVPLGVGLVKCGASRGTVLAFMATAPAISPVSLILGLSLLGPLFMGYYLAIVLIGAFLLGWLGNRILPPQAAIRPRDTGFQARESPLSEADRRRPLKERIVRAMRWGFFDLGTEISLDLLFGLSLATLISVLVPAPWIASWLGGSSIFAILMIIVLSLPIYTCSVPSLPVIQRLLLLGASPGVGIAYLIAGPATNLGELSVIRKAMGNRTTLYYIAGLTLIAIGGGMLVNALLLDDSGTRMIGHAARHLSQQITGVADREALWKYLCESGWIVQTSTLLIMIVLGVGSYRKIRLLFSDPCRHCMFWNDVSRSAQCAGMCWLKETQQSMRRFVSAFLVCKNR